MLELFSRKGDIFEKEAIGPCVPIPLGDEVSSPSSPAHPFSGRCRMKLARVYSHLNRLV